MVLVAVPAIMATSPEHQSRTTTFQVDAALDADRPAAAFVGTIELDGEEPEDRPDASVHTVADPDQPPVRAVLAPARGGDQMVSSDQEDEGRLRLPCGDPCRVEVRVVVELADDSGRPWAGVVELVVDGSVTSGGDVRVSLAPDVDRAAPVEAMAPPVSTGSSRPPEQVAADLDPTLVARGRRPGARSALVVRVSGPTDAVRRSQYALLVDGRGSLLYEGDRPGHEPSGSALAINPGGRCTGTTCREEFLISSPEAASVSVTSLTAPVPGVEVEVVEALGLAYAFDVNDPHIVTVPVPGGWDLLAQADGYGYSSEDDEVPVRLLLRSGSTTTDIGGEQPSLVRVRSCPATEPEGCPTTLEADAIQGGNIDAFLLPTWP